MIFLEHEAKKNKVKINTYIVNLLKKHAELNINHRFPTYHDLDALAGTWSAQEATLFLKNISDI